MDNKTNDLFATTVIGHPAGLFVVFFTEMWERFSFYGMRALLVLFFVAAVDKGGWGWDKGTASSLFGTYVGLVYLSTMLGGYVADKIIGFRWAVVLGAFLMTLGHFSMAFESQFSIYLGLILLVFGNGFFKPNMISIISEMYKERSEKKDGAYTIFYMGVNSGAFFGILLCGYLGEKVGWGYGFGLAGVFMFLGTLQFWLSQNIFGNIGLKPVKKNTETASQTPLTEGVAEDNDKRVPFTPFHLVCMGVSALLGILWILNVPITKISKGAYNIFNFQLGGLSGNNVAILSGLVLFFIVLIHRMVQYSKVTRERMIAVAFFAFIVVFFWAIFEQTPNSLTLFAKDYVNRVLVGNASFTFLIVNSLMTIVPLLIINWVMFKLFQKTFSLYPVASLLLSLSFVIIWTIALWMLLKDYYSAGYIGLSDSTLQFLRIEKVTQPLTEVPATWFATFNSLFIITLAPLFSKVWESKYNPTANGKYAIGMLLLGMGMASVAYGSKDIVAGATTANVNMIWLVLVYLFFTMGELCISPVGLSYVSKLVPARMIAFMFGVWYLATAIGMKTAGVFGENVEHIAKTNGISYFFTLLATVSFCLAAFAILMQPVIRKLMHGIR